jgi:hypothetical protein
MRVGERGCTFGRRNLLLNLSPNVPLPVLYGVSVFGFRKEQRRLHVLLLASTSLELCTLLEKALYHLPTPPKPTPLYIRAQGMSLATATTWFFNFILSVTWPSLLKAFKPQGVFSWYAGWNLIGFAGVLFFVPETKGKMLKELDQVFGV